MGTENSAVENWHQCGERKGRYTLMEQRFIYVVTLIETIMNVSLEHLAEKKH